MSCALWWRRFVFPLVDGVRRRNLKQHKHRLIKARSINRIGPFILFNRFFISLDIESRTSTPIYWPVCFRPLFYMAVSFFYGDHMIIRNNAPRVIVVHLLGSVVTISPGVNAMSKEHWDEFQKFDAFKKDIDDGLISADTEAPTETPTEAPTNTEIDPRKNALDSMNAKNAALIVVDTFDQSLLELWAAVEKRQGVKDAIAKQLEAIKPEQPKDEDK